MPIKKRKKFDFHSSEFNPRLVALIVILIAVTLLFVWKFNWEIKNEAVSLAPGSSERKKEVKPLTMEQIQEALGKKAESRPGSRPLTNEEIQKSLNAKANQ